MCLFTYVLSCKYICDLSITEKGWSQKLCVLIPNLPSISHDHVHQHALHFISQRGDLISVHMYNEQSQGNKKRTNQTYLLTNMPSGQTASHYMMKATTTTISATSAMTMWSQWKNCGSAKNRKKGCWCFVYLQIMQLKMIFI